MTEIAWFRIVKLNILWHTIKSNKQCSGFSNKAWISYLWKWKIEDLSINDNDKRETHFIITGKLYLSNDLKYLHCAVFQNVLGRIMEMVILMGSIVYYKMQKRG